MTTPDYQLRRSARAKLARIIVSVDKVEVVAPLGMSQQQITRFVHAKQHWISEALKKIHAKSQSRVSLSPERYQHGVRIPYQGGHHRLELSTTPLKRAKIAFNGTTFQIALPQAISIDEQHNAIKHVLTQWMRQTLKQHILHCVAIHAPRHQLVPRVIRVKTQKSRWGSCSSQHDININWLLSLAPPVILEYVVVHELCHIKVPNHSAEFWQLVAEHLPDYQQHRRWLKQHGASVMLGL